MPAQQSTFFLATRNQRDAERELRGDDLNGARADFLRDAQRAVEALLGREVRKGGKL